MEIITFGAACAVVSAIMAALFVASVERLKENF